MDADSPGSRSVFYDEGDTVVVTINSYSPDGTMATDDDHFTNGDRSTQCQLYQNGLHFRLSSSKEAIFTITYAGLPGARPSPVDWKMCCTSDSDLPGEHIICYHLTNSENSLPAVVEECCEDESNVVGLIIVNFEKNCFLPDEILKNGIPEAPPIYVVSVEDGEQIFDFISAQLNVGNTQVRVLVESVVDSESTGMSRRPSKAKKFKTPGTFQYSLYEELKKYLKKEKTLISADQSKFQIIFSAFQNYENQTTKESPEKAIKLLDNSKEEMFNKDFMFYLLVAYRLQMHFDKYNCDDVVISYLRHCIEKFEGMGDIHEIAGVMHSFVERGDFTVQWYHHHNSTCSVFLLLHHMAIVLLDKSIIFQEKIQGKSSRVPVNTIYHRILWVSVSIFFGLHAKLPAANLSTKWTIFLVSEKVLEKHQFSNDVIGDFVKGFQIFNSMKLPENVLFDSSTFGANLNPLVCKGLHLSHIRQIISAGITHLHWNIQFLCCFLPPLRSHYEKLFNKHKDRNLLWDGCSDDGTKLGVYKEATVLLEFLSGFINKKNEDNSEVRMEAIEVEIIKFLEMLVNHVDLRASNAVELLKALQYSKHLSKKYRKIVTNTVNERGMREIKHLNLTQICTLFKCLPVWKYQVVEEFLNHCPIPLAVDLKHPPWSTVIETIITWFSDANCRKSIVLLLKRIGEAYVEDKQQYHFVKDLMLLNVPGLLQLPKNDDDDEVKKLFIEMICGYIKRNALQEVILEQVLSFVELVKPENHLQCTLLKALEKEIVPDSRMIEKIQSNTLKQLITRSVKSVRSTVTSLSQLSVIDKFYWSFIASCCNHIQVGVKDLNKLSDFYFALEKFSEIYKAYCDQRENISQPMHELPEEIKYNPNNDVKDYFNWIIKIQKIYIHWQELFMENECNYDDIFSYASSLTTVTDLATLLGTTHLVYGADKVAEFKLRYSKLYEKLCLLLVKGNKDVEWHYTLMEMLNSYGVKFSHTILKMVESYVVLPGVGSSVYASDVQLKLNQSCSEIELDPELILSLRKSVTLKLLLKLFTELESFLDPIWDQLNFFVYFYLYNCEVFSKYLKYQMVTTSTSKVPVNVSSNKVFISITGRQESTKDADEKISQFAVALKNTKKFILSLIEGTATYEDIKGSMEELLPKLDIDSEFKIMSAFPGFQKISTENEEGKQGIKNMLELFQFSKQISLIPKVCEQYHLSKCLNDPKLRELEQIASSVKTTEDKAKITGQKASGHMKHIWKMLNFSDDSKAKRCLKIFPAVAKCPEFYQFIKGKLFTGDTASRSAFRSQIELITAQLQHEDYNERVLNHLLPAFQYIAPFLDTEQNLTELMSKILKLFSDGVGFGRDPRRDFCQLETVNSNITMIQLWFSKAEGDTLENISKELDCIMSTGYFELIIVPKRSNKISHTTAGTVVEYKSEVLLHYQPKRKFYHRKHMQRESFEGESIDSDISSTPLSAQKNLSCLPERWNSEQIDEFVRKLGFLEAQKVEQPVKRFQQLNQTAQTLYHTMLKLRDLGHPDYLQKTDTIQCNDKLEDAKKKVDDTDNKLKEWISTIRNLYKTYDKLMFFSVSKVLSFYDILTTGEFSVNEMMQEIGILFKNDSETAKKLKVAVKNSRDIIMDNAVTKSFSNEAPVAYVGKYLRHLCSDSSVTKYFLYSRSQPSAIIGGKELLPSQEIVRYAPNYDNGQLLLLLIEIYNGVPESYEVFHCSEDSTEEDLRLFLHRAYTFRRQTFTILEVNKLPYKLQEVILHHHSQEVQGLESAIHLNYIETNDSVLHEMPWVVVKEYKKNGLDFSWDRVKRICGSLVNNKNSNFTLELVYGCAGDGKTHYIRKQLCDPYLIIAVNESFTILSAISRLRTLPPDQQCSIFFNFSIVPGPLADTATPEEKAKYDRLMNLLAWFFFKLFVFGYVEDLKTGIAFRLPGGLNWKIFVEVPSHVQENVKHSYDWFRQKIPVFNMIGKEVLVDKSRPYDVNESVQLVCKYLHAYEHRSNVKWGINKLYDENTPQKLVQFSSDPNLKTTECHQLLKKYMPPHVTKSKVLQQLFIKYMERRCKFLERFPGFNYNSGCGIRFDRESVTPDKLQRMMDTGMLRLLSNCHYSNTEKLGEVLIKTMLDEVSEFCKIDVQHSWTLQSRQQLVYEVTEGSGTIRLITLKPESLNQDEAMKFKVLGIEIPSLIQLLKRETFDSYLSSALGVKLKNERLQDIDESHYVLTLDYTVKMLNIHERRQCGIPVIIEGETGVGKTALINMLSKLWNHAMIDEWRKVKGRIVEYLYKISCEFEDNNLKSSLEKINTHGWHSDKQSLSHNSSLTEEQLVPLLEHTPQDSDTHNFEYINKELLKLINTTPILELIEIDVEAVAIDSQPIISIDDDSVVVKLVDKKIKECSSQATAKMLCILLNGNLVPTFYKLNVHAALTPQKIQEFFTPIIDLAKQLKNSAKKLSVKTAQEPLITVFLDELNTSSCMGLFKEMIVDKSFEGEPLPSNIFLIAACNPHRGNSLVVHQSKQDVEPKNDSETETWFRGSYYVQKLHPTLKFLMWNYGSLNDEQEADYIKEKMKMVNDDEIENVQNIAFSELVVKCQELIRQFAYEQLRKLGVGDNDANLRASSCVSQRDIQRVFTFYCWIIKTYETLMMPSAEDASPATMVMGDMLDAQIVAHPMIKDGLDRVEVNQRALLVALGLVYYMKLNTDYRARFIKELDKKIQSYSVKFSEAFTDEMNYYINKLSLPTGIAKTEALKENLFATIICTVTNTPLIIVGAPGSSKTLSFNLTISNLKGPESREALFRNTEVFKSLDPHYYQCSRRTTSTEIETVFQRAINRQHSHDGFSMPIRCVVFMDEAGLPEESHESLKVLHYHLDQQEVAFVGITNHVLDAAKTNRAVSLFRPTASHKDLETLAKGCLCLNPNQPPPDLVHDIKTIVKFCSAYYQVMLDKRFENFFGLRDFIHFINYIRRNRQGSVNASLVLQSLERNFNGSEDFEHICSIFLEKIDAGLNTSDSPKQRTIVEILRDSLADKPYNSQTKHRSLDDTQNEVRYKLIIDPSEDESITRLLFMFGILKFENTRTFMCSNFPGDSQLQKINTIAAIRHSAIEGHTVIMSQTDDIHESFYDLFNQHFRRIDDPEVGPRYFTNIAIGAHTKPSRVHQNFQCIVVIKESEIKNTPAPFLNRFEKYYISHRNLLNLVLKALPPWLKVIVDRACKKVDEFYILLDESAFYGSVNETVCSLLLSILPRPGHKYKEASEFLSVIDTPTKLSNTALLLHTLLKCLHEMGGFCYMESTTEELEHDASSIIELLATTGSEFGGVASKLDNSDPHTILEWVTEALDLLYLQEEAPNIKDFDSGDGSRVQTLSASNGACMVIALITQWLVRFMCKKLMQLMTPEALILKRKSLPISYLEAYLNYQTHFSLSGLITNHIQMLDQCSGHKIATKLICYTRSSSLIHQLPTIYPRPAHSSTEELHKSKKSIETLIYDKVENLFLCKFSGVSSQTSFKLQLQSFKDSSQQTVFVLIINMKETNSQIINHIRIMIEEVDFSNGLFKKLFVLLLHFPPTMFYEPCYPALFLYGWDHYYLDTISQSKQLPVMDVTDQAKPTSLVDIRIWFRQSCLSISEVSSSPTTTPIDSMSTDLLTLLNKPESIQVIASRILLTSTDSTQFSLEALPNITAKYSYLKQLLVDKKVGDVLCSKFRSYWKPSVIGNHLEQAASFAKSRESTLSISDSVDSAYKTSFFNFIAYMIYEISKSRGLELLFSSHCDDATLDLFLKLLDVYPVPKLSEIKAFNNTWDCRIHAIGKPTYISQFPLFRDISTYINNMIQQNIDKSNENIDILQDSGTSTVAAGLVSKDQMLKKLYNSLFNEIDTVMKGDKMVGEKHAIAVAVKETQNDEEMWQKYYNEFVSQYLHMSAAPDSIEYKLLRLTFDDALNNYSEMKAIAIHCYMYLYQLDLAKVVALLKPLTQLKVIKDENSVYPDDPEQSIVFTSQAVQGTNISRFIVDSLFLALINILYHNGKKQNLFQEWYSSYRDLMSMTLLKHIANTDLMDLVKVKYHIMETTFTILQLFDHVNDITEECACVVAMHLCNKLFGNNFQLNSDVSLNLENMINFIDVALASPQFDQIKKQQLHLLVHNGLLTQFFPEIDDLSSFLGSDGLSYCKADVEFFVKFANDKMPPIEEVSPENLRDRTCNCISLCKFKFHLDKILCRGWSKGKDLSKPLNLYKTEVCILIGDTLLSTYTEANPSDYVPPYLQQTQKDKNPLMQQKLAHLYFYTVLERLQSCQQSPSQLMSLLKTIDKKLCKTDGNADKVIIHIERQAVMEVLLQTIVNSFDTDDKIGMKNLLESAKDINNLVNHESHLRIMLMYLLKKHHGPRGVLNLLSKKKSEYWNCFECLKSIKEQLEASPPPTSHLFPFIVGGPNAKPQFTVMYKEICGHLLQISCGSSADKIKTFVDYITSVLNSGGKSYDGVSCVRMMIWLCVYHEFYCKKKHLPELIPLFERIKNNVKFSDAHLNTLRCFVDPANMINEAEIPNPLNPNTEMLELTETGTLKRKAPTGIVDKEDPIWKFFNPEHEDPSDTDLRHALANMIAVAFALPSRSNHIWYHMFYPEGLEKTHLTGFMYPNKVKKGGLMYDCGCELNEDGQYGRKDYIPHATRGTLSLHSWYLMLWTNFGAFCVGLLTQPKALDQMKGRILSDWMSIRFYCITQLRTVWLHMRTNMGFGDDERSFFIMRSMHTLFMLFQDGKYPFTQGKFIDIKSLDAYEKSWHTCIYEPCKGNLQAELEKNFSDSVWVLPVLKNYRTLNEHYPHLTTENEYMKSLVAAREAHGLDNTHLFALHLLTLEYDRLQVGGALLPDLVEFYQWIHTHLSYLVTYEKAQQITIGKVISLSAKRYSQELCEHLTDLFKRIINKYNSYLKINGGTIGEASCDRAAKPTDAKCIDENTPLIALISHKNKEIADYDWLYIVLMHIIGCHNSFLNSIFNHAKDPNCHYRKYLPDSPPESHPTEVTSQSCIVPSDGDTGKQQFLKLITSYSMYNGVQTNPLFDLEQLEQSVVAFYIAGKPLIISDDIRIIFRFRDSPNETTLGNNPGCAIDVSSVAQELPNNFKEPLPEETKKSLEYQFRTATYQTLTEVVTGLRTILGHLIQDILQQEHKVWETRLNIALASYLKNSFSKDPEIVFGEIGIQSISYEQKVIFGEIEMKRLFECMGLFVGWLQGGLYDFSTLPVSVFKHLDDEDKEALQKIPNKYLSAEKDLLTDFGELEKTLNHAENHLTTQAELRKSIKESLLELGLCEPTEKLITLIPESILTYHYVQFRMTLRKIKLKVVMLVNLQPQNLSTAQIKWTEIIEDLWKDLWKYLPHFQNEDQLYDENCLKFDCIKLQFGDGEESESDDEPWPHDDDPTVEGESSDSQVPTPNKNETEPAVPSPAVPVPVSTPVTSVLLSAKPSGKAENMTTKELCEWLKTVNVSDDYIKLFEENDINGGILTTFTDEDLKDMGISKGFIRKKIMVQLRQIQ